MAWNPWQTPIDYVLIATAKTPGICDVQGADSPRNWTEVSAYGMGGSTLIFRGLGNSDFKLRLRLYSDQDWEDWTKFSRIVKATPVGVRPKTLSIWHPFLEDLGISAVGITNVSQPEEIDDGGFAIIISCRQYRKMRMSLSKPQSAQNKPTDPVDQTINSLTGLVARADKGEIVSTDQISQAMQPTMNMLAE